MTSYRLYFLAKTRERSIPFIGGITVEGQSNKDGIRLCNESFVELQKNNPSIEFTRHGCVLKIIQDVIAVPVPGEG